MLSTEGRCAYAQWRGEEDSCRLEDLSYACDAAISSLSTMSCGSWLEIEMNSSNQSLFYGERLLYRTGPVFKTAMYLTHKKAHFIGCSRFHTAELCRKC